MGGSTQQRYEGLRERPGAAGLLAHEVARRVPGRRDLVCAGCGYGIVVSDEPERCPLCGGTDWDFAPWRPFSGGGGTLVA